MPAPPAHTDLVNFLAVAQRIVADADQILLDGFGKVTVAQKADGSLVTQTDRNVDEVVGKAITLAFPDHAVLSEERNMTYDPTVAFSWVVDPLDGTTNFARGLPVWGISIALLYFGQPVVGFLSFVSLREDYQAIRYGGATRNGRRIVTATDSSADDQHFVMLCTRTPRTFEVTTPLKPRIMGSAAYHLACVANGSALAGIESTPKIWDIAAALLILSEAGGCYRRLGENREIFPLDPIAKSYEGVSFPLVAAANQAILDELQMHIKRRF